MTVTHYRLISAVAMLLVDAIFCFAQDGSIVIKCPPMPVLKIRVGLWQCQKEVSDCKVTFKSGEVLDFPAFDIPPTYVRGTLRKAVDPCISSGMSADGSILTLNLPREPVKGFVALQMTATGWLTRPSGKKYAATAVYPNCVSVPVSLREMRANAVQANGTLTEVMPP